jgi:hypothetical protein
MGVHDRFPALDAEVARYWKVRERRFEIAGLTSVTTETGEVASARVLNLSRNGCRIATFAALRPGEQLKLMLEPLGLVEAVVRWSDNNEAGLEIVTRDPFPDTYEFGYPP